MNFDASVKPEITVLLKMVWMTMPIAFPERIHVTFSLKVLEEIRVGLELNEYGAQQKRLTHLRFLGEVYNYEHIDSSVIFETLYLTLSYGHGTSGKRYWIRPKIFSVSGWLSFFWKHVDTTLIEVLQALIWIEIRSGLNLFYTDKEGRKPASIQQLITFTFDYTTKITF
ncbi:hypothetical protein F2Q69_00053719 [Brassica cretica]|uniref:MIF4G domain-containing protein n=1 Tax=Brassica cretica TaxID=69181 RepID=A0A8S9MZK2_BRACR|nr:hypothetical protein F2Q69_00053719 [Brassica cretica]